MSFLSFLGLEIISLHQNASKFFTHETATNTQAYMEPSLFSIPYITLPRPARRSPSLPCALYQLSILSIYLSSIHPSIYYLLVTNHLVA